MANKHWLLTCSTPTHPELATCVINYPWATLVSEMCQGDPKNLTIHFLKSISEADYQALHAYHV